MNVTKVGLRNFRRLENVTFGLECSDTVFVGPNNSGKTSATDAFRLFLGRREFKIHDFSVSRIVELDAIDPAGDVEDWSFPSIGLDLWFSVDPDVEYGRVSSLLPDASVTIEEVGIRLEFGVKDGDDLMAAYVSAFPPPEVAGERKSLSHFLALQGNLNRHYGLRYYALQNDAEAISSLPLDPEEGKRVLAGLIRVDFVDAQRNLDDEEAGRSNRLSTAFETFYRKNLTQAEASEEANRVIDENNERLNQHYKQHFAGLMAVLDGLGVPSVNDRKMRIASSLTPEAALKGGASLLYVDPASDHELPEAYNGLGFKNLIYMAIQVSHFHLQWMKTDQGRPLCQIVFIEEPEAHLHPQVQRVFVANIWDIVKKASIEAGEAQMTPQLVITTHSSHILDTVDFEQVRYFKRCGLGNEDETKGCVHNGSKVLSLRDFRPTGVSAAGEAEEEAVTLRFLSQYMKLTHCDLFFADAAILVEGTAEKLLLSAMIGKCATGLETKFLTILEVGGAYAHRFASLLEFLGIPYLIITDLDSVDVNDRRKTCRADAPGAITSNASLVFFLGKRAVDELTGLAGDAQVVDGGKGCIAFQCPTFVGGHGENVTMHGRTFEETFVYQNLQLFRDGTIRFGKGIPENADAEGEYQAVYEGVKSSSFKKTEFALDVASSSADWATPLYIESGLKWLGYQTALVVEEDVN
ncbi:MAG: AAA family ATPase [Coriobacteriia bacterium]|nr:AAA family ATPase [Coriobacteriia bacterium]